MTGLDPARLANARADLEEAARWRLPPGKWDELDVALDFVASALASDGPVELRRARGLLYALSPKRASASADEQVAAGDERLDRINHLVDALDDRLADRADRADRAAQCDDDRR